MGLARALETQTTEHNNLKTNQILLKQQQHSNMTLNSAALQPRSFLSLALPVARQKLWLTRNLLVTPSVTGTVAQQTSESSSYARMIIAQVAIDQ